MGPRWKMASCRLRMADLIKGWVMESIWVEMGVNGGVDQNGAKGLSEVDFVLCLIKQCLIKVENGRTGYER